MKEIVQTAKGAAPKGPYSQGVIARCPTLYVAAQGPSDPETGSAVGATFAEQADQVFRNIQAIVEAAGATMADVVKVTVMMDDWANFGTLNELYVRHFPPPYPARTTLVTTLRGVLCMADAVVALPDGGTE